MGIGLYGSFGLFRNDGGNDRAKETSMANHRLVESLFADVGSWLPVGAAILTSNLLPPRTRPSWGRSVMPTLIRRC